MTLNNDSLRQEYTIDTPESVSFDYEVAGIGSRFIAALIDSALIGILLMGLNIIVFLLVEIFGNTSGNTTGSLQEMGWAGGLLIALYILLNFILLWGFYIFFEWLNLGQTPGKVVARIRVIADDGQPVGAWAATIRNVVRIIDFLPAAYLLGLSVMFLNSYSRRLGDFAAGTLVVRSGRAISLKSLRQLASIGGRGEIDERRLETLRVKYPRIDDITEADIALIQEIMGGKQANGALTMRLAAVMAAKLGCPPPSAGDFRPSQQMLSEVLELFRGLRGD